MNPIMNKIAELKKEKDAVILAHYYVDAEVQSIADYVGDSYYLSKLAAELPNQTIVFCGVAFMGESAKILSPQKTVLMPAADADCPMAHMADIEAVRQMRAKYEDLAVVCYINSTAEIKAASDVCVTSSNALKILKKLPHKNIYFIPDANLGGYLAKLVPDKYFFFNQGFCCVHQGITAQAVEAAKKQHPSAKVLAHPECTSAVLSLADYIGSTSGIIDFATNEEINEFIICTEVGVLFELQQKNPSKQFFFPEPNPICVDMKKINLQNVENCLSSLSNRVEIEETLRTKAQNALRKMLELAV
ncbi:MAG: quinolinate synthase NadA [Eubacteriales bacterium]|nr:quinolinate synthase NadA [Eubacteriales bacterium]MDD3349230.1 quinolinate synthase NadA [Eubacteriales bacterium]